MGEYFKGWRRKLGCITLLLACVFTGGWVRSFTVAEYVDYTDWIGRRGMPAVVLTSAYEVLAFDIAAPRYLPQWSSLRMKNIYWYSERQLPNPPPHFQAILEPDEFFKQFGLRTTGLPVYGFTVGSRQKWKPTGPTIGEEIATTYFIVVNYLTLVIPLTLASLWLLLSKPRKSTPMKIPEPIPAEGT